MKVNETAVFVAFSNVTTLDTLAITALIAAMGHSLWLVIELMWHGVRTNWGTIRAAVVAPVDAPLSAEDVGESANSLGDEPATSRRRGFSARSELPSSRSLASTRSLARRDRIFSGSRRTLQASARMLDDGTEMLPLAEPILAGNTPGGVQTNDSTVGHPDHAANALSPASVPHFSLVSNVCGASSRAAECATPSAPIPSPERTRRDPEYFRVTSTFNVYWLMLVVSTMIYRVVEVSNDGPIAKWYVTPTSKAGTAPSVAWGLYVEPVLQSMQTLFATICVIQLAWLLSGATSTTPRRCRHYMSFWTSVTIALFVCFVTLGGLILNLNTEKAIPDSTTHIHDHFRVQCFWMYVDAFVAVMLLLQLYVVVCHIITPILVGRWSRPSDIANFGGDTDEAIMEGFSQILRRRSIRAKVLLRVLPVVLVELLRCSVLLYELFAIDIARAHLEGETFETYGGGVPVLMSNYGKLLEPVVQLIVFVATDVFSRSAPSSHAHHLWKLGYCSQPRLCDLVQSYDS